MRRPHDRIVFTSNTVRIGEFRCALDDPAWSEINRAEVWPAFAIPSIPVRIRQADRDPFVADSNTAIFFAVDHPYTRSKVHEDGARAISIDVAPGVVAECVAEYDPAAVEGPGKLFRHSHGPVDSDAYLTTRLLFEHVGRHRLVDTLRVEETALAVLERVVAAAFKVRGEHERPQRRSTARAHARLAEDAKELLAVRFAEGWTLESAARTLGTSPFHLARVFRCHTGVTLHRYLNRLRLRAALERLRDESVTLAAIARASGFAGHPHFTDVFRQEFGVPPSKVRERIVFGDPPEVSI